MNKITKFIIAALIALTGIFVSLPTAPTYAIDDICNTGADPEVKRAAGCTSDANKQLPDAITIILNAIIGISGLVAVTFVIIGGINYMTANGDAGKLKTAKNTILYALIGLIICALAFAIVNWVIGSILKQGS